MIIDKDCYSYAEFYPKIGGKYVTIIYEKVYFLEDKLSVLPYTLNDQEDLYQKYLKEIKILDKEASKLKQRLTFELEYTERVYVTRNNIYLYELEDIIN